MKNLLLVILCLFINLRVFAFDIVYPGSQNVTINSPSTFFIGSANPNSKLTINGECVNIHNSGGFAFVVKLNEGDNRFVIKSEDGEKSFLIKRPKKTVNSVYTPPEFIQYKSKQEFMTLSDNVPLRNTPVNSGVNRLAHFPKDIPLTVDGEKSNFYRVILGPDKNAWVDKSDVKAFEGKLNSPAVLSGYNFVDDDNYFTYIFHLDKKVPYEMVENESLELKFYNVKDNPNLTYVFSFPYFEKTGVKKIIGYSGDYEGNDFVLKIRKFPPINKKHPLNGIKIAVDAGHGGKESGAIGCCGDKEKDITLAIAKYLEKELENRGANVIMTRSDDSYVSLKDRVDTANNGDAMFLISIHANSLPDSANPNEHQGTSVYYYYNQAKLFAANILVAMNTYAGTKNDKIRQGSLALVRNTKALSVLVEVAYLINPEDNSMITNVDFQKRCAKAIANGIEDFLKN